MYTAATMYLFQQTLIFESSFDYCDVIFILSFHIHVLHSANLNYLGMVQVAFLFNRLNIIYPYLIRRAGIGNSPLYSLLLNSELSTA